jgi:hypothetical protein
MTSDWISVLQALLSQPAPNTAAGTFPVTAAILLFGYLFVPGDAPATHPCPRCKTGKLVLLETLPSRRNRSP